MRKREIEGVSESGFTLIEVLVAMAGIGVIVGIVAGMLFNGLSWQDRVRVASRVQDSGRVLSRQLRKVVEEGGSVTGAGPLLMVAGESECWSFSWDQIGKQLNYGVVEALGCVPPVGPTASFLAEEIEVTGFDVVVRGLSTGGTEVRVTFELSMSRPLGEYSESFSSTIINLVD